MLDAVWGLCRRHVLADSRNGYQSCEFIWQNCFYQTFWGITLICIIQKSPQVKVQTFLQIRKSVVVFFFLFFFYFAISHKISNAIFLKSAHKKMFY